MSVILSTVLTLTGNATKRSDAAMAARALLDRFRTIDWDARATMVKQPSKEDTAWKTRLEVEHRLATLDRPAVPILIKALEDTNRHVRALAAYVLGLRAELRAAATLRRVALADKDATVRLYVVEALGRIGEESARPLLERVHQNDPNMNVRYAAEQALLRLAIGKNGREPLHSLVRLFNPQQMSLAVRGKPAPEFSLESDERKPIRLSDFRGNKPVVLLFQLADW
jgi:hypothetical protein